MMSSEQADVEGEMKVHGGAGLALDAKNVLVSAIADPSKRKSMMLWYEYLLLCPLRCFLSSLLLIYSNLANLLVSSLLFPFNFSPHLLSLSVICFVSL
jgi:hypothetical protein